jgi:hypothetical protein
MMKCRILALILGLTALLLLASATLAQAPAPQEREAPSIPPPPERGGRLQEPEPAATALSPGSGPLAERAVEPPPASSIQRRPATEPPEPPIPTSERLPFSGPLPPPEEPTPSMQLSAPDLFLPSEQSFLTVEVNADTDIISGEAPPNTDLEVEIWDYDWYETRSDGEGHYSFDAWTEAGIDLQPGMEGRVRYRTEEGHQISARFAVPFLRVSQSEDTVEGIAIPNATVNVTVTRGTETFVASTTAEGDGWFVIDGWEFSPEVDVQVDDIVEMSSDGVSRTLTVVAMTGVPNIEFDTISGHIDGASEDDPVRIEIWGAGGGSVDTTTDASGNYDTDLGGWDLKAGHELGVWYITGDGDECGITVAYLMIFVNLTADWIDGGTQPTATLNITLTGSGIKGTAMTNSDKDGYFFTNIYTDATVVDIISGDSIQITADGRQASVDAILTVEVNAVADTISGYTVPDTDVMVRIDDGDRFWVQSDGTGYYEFDAGAEGINLESGMGGRVRSATHDGHWVTASFEVQKYYIYLPLVMKSF